MSRTCKSIATGRPFATAFFGGLGRGKVVQLHMGPDDLTTLLGLFVTDECSPEGIRFDEWLALECANASMNLFDFGLAAPKVSTVPVETL